MKYLIAILLILSISAKIDGLNLL